MSTSPLERMQLDLWARIDADPYFADIGVILLRPRASASLTSIRSRVDRMLAGTELRGGKCGAAVQVLMPLADAIDRNAPGPLLNFRLVVQVLEHVIENMGPRGTGKSAEEIALRVLQIGHHFNAGRGATLLAAENALVPGTDEKDDNRIVIDCSFELRGGVASAAKCARPAISPAGGGAAPQTVTLTCATAGARIFYTTDDSLPTPVNSAATLYAAPFLVSEACTLRVAAFATDYLPSDAAQIALT